MILHLQHVTENKYELNKNCEQVEIYNINSKVDTLMFYLEEYLIVASKDQDIKVIRYSQLPAVKQKEAKIKEVAMEKK